MPVCGYTLSVRQHTVKAYMDKIIQGTVKTLNWNQNDGSSKIDVGPSFSFE